jgi:hypothetical protein
MKALVISERLNAHPGRPRGLPYPYDVVRFHRELSCSHLG